MTKARIARFREESEGFNTLAPSRAPFQLEIHDDSRLPEGAELVVEGFSTPLRLRAEEYYDEEKGIYRFPIDDPPAGSCCRIALEIGEESAILAEDFDLHAYIQEASESEETPPPPIDIPDELFEHVREIGDDEVAGAVPEDEEWEVLIDLDSDEAGDEAEALPEEPAEDSDEESDLYEEN